MTTMTDQKLQARDAGRDIGAELLQAVRELRAGHHGRRTRIQALPDGTVRRQVQQADGTVTTDEVLTGARWALLSARDRAGMSQAHFAAALGVSRRTLENWEQGRVQPSGPAKVLLHLLARYPDTVKRLAQMQAAEQNDIPEPAR